MMQLYFRMVHPNLPIVAEDEFWSLWHGDDFHLGQYSLLLLRAMIFAATSVCLSSSAQEWVVLTLAIVHRN